MSQFLSLGELTVVGKASLIWLEKKSSHIGRDTLWKNKEQGREDAVVLQGRSAGMARIPPW